MEGWLASVGLEQIRGWMMFERGCDVPAAESTSLMVREAKPAEAYVFGRTACDAFDIGEAAIPWMARLVGRSG